MYAYPPSSEAAWPLIRLPPFPPRTVGLRRYAFPPSTAAPRALTPYAAHLRPNHLRRSPMSQSPGPFAPSLSIRRPSSSGASQTPPWPLGRTCHGASGLPWLSQGHPWTLPVLVVLARRGSPSNPTPTTEIDRTRPSPSLCCKCMFKCFRCFRGMSQLLHMDVIKVDWDELHMLHIFASLFSYMLQAFWKKMFQKYVEVSVLRGRCIFFTHMLQVFYLNVAYVSHICCNCIFKCFIYVWYMLHPCVSCCNCFTGHGGWWAHDPDAWDGGTVGLGVDEGAVSQEPAPRSRPCGERWGG
jgi:hypothetical protein